MNEAKPMLSHISSRRAQELYLYKKIAPNLHHQLTPCIRDLFEKITVPQLVKIFALFYGNRSFITVFETACHVSTSAAR